MADTHVDAAPRHGHALSRLGRAGVVAARGASPGAVDRRRRRRRRRCSQQIKAADTDLLAVSEEDGRFLRVMVASSGAKRALEIGGANGYSAIWIGLGLRADRRPSDDDRIRPGARESRRRATSAAPALPTSSPSCPATRSRRSRSSPGDVRLRLPRRVEARLQALFRPDVAAAAARRPVPRAQRREQAERDARFPRRDPRTTRAVFTSIVTPSGEGMSVSVKLTMTTAITTRISPNLPCKPVHIIGVPLDLGGGRRGVDMGPSAFRIAGLGERLAALGYTVVDQGDLPTPIPETQELRDERKKYIRDIAQGLPAAVPDRRSQSLDEGAMPLVLGGDHSLAAGSVAAAADWAQTTTRAADRAALGRRARRHEHAGDVAVSGNVHGMPLAALLGPEPAELSRIGGVLAESAAGAHGARRHPQSRRAREDARARFARARLHDEGHRSPGHRVDRGAGGEPRRQRHRGHPRVVRHGRLRSGDRARRRHAGERRPRLPRGAHGDGDRRRLGAAHLARPGRGEPDARRAEHAPRSSAPSSRCRR